MVSTGQVDGIGSHLCTAINADGTTLYFSGHDSRGVHVASVDVETGNQNWSITTDDIDGESKLVALRDGSLLLTNWSGWLQLDAASGEVLRNVTPRTRYGFRHHWSRLDPFNGGVISWQRAPIVEPAAFWSPSLELESLLFATDCHSWISLSADGELISTHQPTSPPVRRYVGETSATYEPAVWAKSARPRPVSPFASLSVIRYHSDGRTTIQPFE